MAERHERRVRFVVIDPRDDSGARAIDPRLVRGHTRRLCEARAERITAEQVFRLAAEGDPVAQRIVDEVLTYLSIALANMTQFVNPGKIIIGGPVAQAGELLIAPLQERIRALCLPAIGQAVQVVQSKYGSEASIVGAVTLALQDV